jgi:hypothetical protein
MRDGYKETEEKDGGNQDNFFHKISFSKGFWKASAKRNLVRSVSRAISIPVSLSMGLAGEMYEKD